MKKMEEKVTKNDLFPALGRFERFRFPEELCVVPSINENGIMDAEQKFLCLMVDKCFANRGGLVVAMPYICTLDENGVPHPQGTELFGWVDAHGNWYDHWERNVHDDDLVVTAWTPVPADFDLRACFLPTKIIAKT